MAAGEEQWSLAVAGGVGASRPVRPLLEPAAAAVVTQPYDPQVAVLLAERVPVAHLGPHDRGVTVDGENFGGEGERLAGAVPVLIPHPPDRAHGLRAADLPHA